MPMSSLFLYLTGCFHFRLCLMNLLLVVLLCSFAQGIVVAGGQNTQDQKQNVQPQQQVASATSEAEAYEAIQKDPTKAEPYIILGALNNNRLKLDLAREYILRALELRPDEAEAHHQLALNLGYREEWDKSFLELQVALKAKPLNSIYHYNLGSLYYNSQQHYSEALSEFRRALEIQPNNEDYNLAVATTLDALGELDAAEAEFSKIIRKYPDMARAYYGRAETLRRRGETERARLDAEKALTLDPKLAAAFFLLGKVFTATGEPRKALEAYLQVIKLEENHINAHYQLRLLYRRLGMAKEAEKEKQIHERLKAQLDSASAVIFGTNYLKQGDFSRAEEQFTSAVLIDPTNTEALYNLGLVQQHKGDYAAAVETFKRALTLNPNLPILHAYLGQLLAKQGRAAEARLHLARAGELEAQDFAVSYAIARGFLLLRDYPQAESWFLHSLQLWPNRPAVLIELFQLYTIVENTEKAQLFAERAIEATPQDARLRYRVGLFFASEKQFGRAIEELRKAIELKSDYDKPYFVLASIHYDLRQINLASKALEEYLRLSPNSGEGHYFMGKLLLEKGDIEKAITELKAAADLSSEDAQIFFLLSLAYQQTGRKKEADEALNRYQQLNSHTPAATDKNGGGTDTVP